MPLIDMQIARGSDLFVRTLVGNICVCDVRFARNYFREGAHDQPRNRPLMLHDLQIPTYNRTSLAKLPAQFATSLMQAALGRQQTGEQS